MISAKVIGSTGISVGIKSGLRDMSLCTCVMGSCVNLCKYVNNDDPIGASFGSFTLKGGLICLLAQFNAKEPLREGLKPAFFLGSQVLCRSEAPFPIHTDFCRAKLLACDCICAPPNKIYFFLVTAVLW